MTPPARGAHGESSSTGFYPDCEHREMTPGEAFIDLDADGAVFIVGREPVQHVGYLADDVMREFVDAFNALSGRDPAKVAALLALGPPAVVAEFVEACEAYFSERIAPTKTCLNDELERAFDAFYALRAARGCE